MTPPVFLACMLLFSVIIAAVSDISRRAPRQQQPRERQPDGLRAAPEQAEVNHFHIHGDTL